MACAVVSSASRAASASAMSMPEETPADVMIRSCLTTRSGA
jgi:hypothetical protein